MKGMTYFVKQINLHSYFLFYTISDPISRSLETTE